MKKHYECQPSVWHEKPLIFDWDDETGDVTGPGAELILKISTFDAVLAGPYPMEWKLSNNPLSNKTDMAAIIGLYWRVPDDLLPFYPKLVDPGPFLDDLTPGATIG